MVLVNLGMGECGNVIDQLEERFAAFFAHERKSYRERLNHEQSARARQAGQTEGVGEPPAEVQDSDAQDEDRTSQEFLSEGVQDDEEMEQPGPLENVQGEDELSEPSSGLYPPSRDSGLVDGRAALEGEWVVLESVCNQPPSQKGRKRWTQEETPEEAAPDSMEPGKEKARRERQEERKKCALLSPHPSPRGPKLALARELQVRQRKNRWRGCPRRSLALLN